VSVAGVARPGIAEPDEEPHGNDVRTVVPATAGIQ